MGTDIPDDEDLTFTRIGLAAQRVAAGLLQSQKQDSEDEHGHGQASDVKPEIGEPDHSALQSFPDDRDYRCDETNPKEHAPEQERDKVVVICERRVVFLARSTARTGIHLIGAGDGVAYPIRCKLRIRN